MRTAFLALTSLAVVACSSTATSENPPSPPVSRIVIPIGAATAGTNAFTPSSTTISLASVTSVKWVNRDGVTHHITDFPTDEFLDTGDIAPGGSSSMTFTQIGVYHFHCSIHPSMTGTLDVIR
jgi:plastocyanin